MSKLDVEENNIYAVLKEFIPLTTHPRMQASNIKQIFIVFLST